MGRVKRSKRVKKNVSRGSLWLEIGWPLGDVTVRDQAFWVCWEKVFLAKGISRAKPLRRSEPGVAEGE